MHPSREGPPRKLVIFGAGGHATSVADAALSSGWDIHAFLDDHREGASLLDRPVRRGLAQVFDPDAHALVLAVGDNFRRERIFEELAREFPGLVTPAIIHRTAFVSPHAMVGPGSVILAMSVIGPNSSVGRLCIVNTRASLDHDCRMEDFASLAPGTTTGGTVSLGRRSAISMGATVKHGVRVGQDTVVGAASYVHRDLGDNVVAYGCPARIVRNRQAGDPYL